MEFIEGEKYRCISREWVNFRIGENYICDGGNYLINDNYRPELIRESFDNFELVIKEKLTKDSIVESVITDLDRRSKLGIDKYGTTLDRTDLSRKEWLQHAYEESLDKSLYLKKLISLEDEI
jgi:hypothetical protein